ncbi:MAG: class I SAM-dependent methyltransferase [Nanoarchaeota archaeon]
MAQVFFLEKWLTKLKNVSYVGVDINKSFLDFAKSQLIKYPNYKFIQEDAVKVRIPEKFDVIVATSSYHHIKDTEKRAYLENISNRLSNKGILVIYEKLVSKFKEPIGAADSASKLYAERIKYLLKTEKPTEKQLFALFNELYLSAIRKGEYKVSYEISLGGFKIHRV